MSLRLVKLGRVFEERVSEHDIEEMMSVWSRVLRRGCVESRKDISEYGQAEAVALYEMGLKRLPVSEGNVCIGLEELGFYDEVRGDPMRVFKDTLELLTRSWPTPLVRLRSLSGGGYGAWAKLEWYNPFSFSVKDRVGWYMIMKFLDKGALPERVFEATSTNTGMALAAMGAIHGFRTRLYIPSGIQRASDVLLKALGAEVVRTGKPLTVDSIEDVSRAAEEEGAVHTNQFENNANFMVHLRFTAKELDLQLRSKHIGVKGIVGGLGTSGHLSALAFYFKNRYGGLKIFGTQPAPGERIPGIRRVETGMKWVHMVRLDGVVDVTQKEAVNALLHVARKDGILPGLSSGAVAAAFMKLRDDGVIGKGEYVLIFPDNGLKYVEQLSMYL